VQIEKKEMSPFWIYHEAYRQFRQSESDDKLAKLWAKAREPSGSSVIAPNAIRDARPQQSIETRSEYPTPLSQQFSESVQLDPEFPENLKRLFEMARKNEQRAFWEEFAAMIELRLADQTAKTANSLSPSTLLQQIDEQWFPDYQSGGGLAAWSVPLPKTIVAQSDIFNDGAVTSMLLGLDIHYDQDFNTIRPVLSSKNISKKALPCVPHTLVNRFWSVTHRLWRWTEHMQLNKQVTPLDKWLLSEESKNWNVGEDRERVQEFVQGWKGDEDGKYFSEVRPSPESLTLKATYGDRLAMKKRKADQGLEKLEGSKKSIKSEVSRGVRVKDEVVVLDP